MAKINFTSPTVQKFYGSFYDTTTQPAASANTAYPISMNSTDLSYGVTVNASSITFQNAGIYNVQWSGQFADTKSAQIDIWVRKNGYDILGSNGTINVDNQNSHALPSWNYFFNLNANDVLQFYWASTSNSTSLVYAPSAVASPYHPSTFSMILTAVQI